ncbi:hypothetical protein JTB14_026642 [Gonioctena quinquepunctata]|nr:hypothetical protein JTB14_026642 [Gonioctena quinquepunctata]
MSDFLKNWLKRKVTEENCEKVKSEFSKNMPQMQELENDEIMMASGSGKEAAVEADKNLTEAQVENCANNAEETENSEEPMKIQNYGQETMEVENETGVERHHQCHSGRTQLFVCHLKEDLKEIALIKCSCHMIHLCASKAALELRRSVEDV